MEMKTFTTQDRRRLFKKIAAYLRDKIIYLNEVERISYSDMCNELNVYNSRLSNLKEKGVLSEPLLIAFIRSGMATIDELTDKVDATEKEKIFLDEYSVFESRSLQKTLLKLRRQGMDEKDINSILEKFLK